MEPRATPFPPPGLCQLQGFNHLIFPGSGLMTMASSSRPSMSQLSPAILLPFTDPPLPPAQTTPGPPASMATCRTFSNWGVLPASLHSCKFFQTQLVQPPCLMTPLPNPAHRDPFLLETAVTVSFFRPYLAHKFTKLLYTYILTHDPIILSFHVTESLSCHLQAV